MAKLTTNFQTFFGDNGFGYIFDDQTPFYKTIKETCKDTCSNKSDINTLRPRQNGCRFPEDIFKCIFLNENVWISIDISLKFVPKGPIDHIPALVQIMAWRRPGDKPLSQPMMVILQTHICVTRSQWVKCRNTLGWLDQYMCTGVRLWNTQA